MKGNLFYKGILSIIALLLLLNLMYVVFSVSTAEAVKKSDEIGRYQISAWAAQVSTGYHHSGYYIVDTVTGKVIDSKSETHTSKK